MLELLVDVENELGECVLWCERSERVLWTDILGAKLYAHDPASGKTSTWPMPDFRLLGAVVGKKPLNLVETPPAEVGYVYPYHSAQV